MGKQIKYEADPNKFDLQVHRWDSQGNLVGKNPYRTFITDGKITYERPVNSGNLWFENNKPAGRVEIVFGENGKISSKEFKFGAPHKEYTEPLSGSDKVNYELEQTRAKNAALEAELALIKKESAKKIEVKEEAKAVPTLTKPGKA